MRDLPARATAASADPAATRFTLLRQVPPGHLRAEQPLSARLNPAAPRRNYADDLAAYRRVYAQAGFTDVVIVDATDETWKPFYRSSKRWMRASLLGRKIGLIKGCRNLTRMVALDLALRQYVLVAARKP